MKHRAWVATTTDADLHWDAGGSRSFSRRNPLANHDTQPLQALEAPVEPWFNRWRMP